MCEGIMNPSDPRYSCDCHLWRDDEEEPEPDEDELLALRYPEYAEHLYGQSD